MDAVYVGIEVAKERLDGHAHPAGEAFSTARNGEGLAQLAERLRALAPALIAVEAAGGFETSAGCRRQSRAGARFRARPARSTR